MTTERTVARSGKSKRKPFNSNVADYLLIIATFAFSYPLVLSDTSNICICAFTVVAPGVRRKCFVLASFRMETLQAIKPNAVDAIVATNPRYAGAKYGWEERSFDANVARMSLIEDAELNTAKAIVAEQLAEALRIAQGRIGELDLISQVHPSVFTLGEIEAALTAWRELLAG
jgi:hypothetical protein